jgi:hypothetical protein
MKHPARIMFLCVTAALLHAQVSLPESGTVRGNDGTLRTLRGVAGAWTLSDPIAVDAISAASSGRTLLWKTADRLHTQAADWPAPEGRALFAFSTAGEPLAAYMLDAQQLLVWRNPAGAPVTLDWQPAVGNVIALGADNAGGLIVLTESEGQVWRNVIAVRSGRMLSMELLEGVSAPALPLSGGRLLYSCAEGLRLRFKDGREIALALADVPDEWELVSQDAVAMRGSSKSLPVLVRCKQDSLELFVLPQGGAQ